ncbi:MAG TPA: SCO family protein [Solirubrobacteraceae bacterium]|nr:SCO family protein [Solirubrobacteraceae bacterium]
MGRRLRTIPVALALAGGLLLALAALALVAVLSVSGEGSSTPAGRASGSSSAGSARASTQAEFDGAPLPGNTIAPNFTLTDQRGRTVSLSEFHGRVVVLTFLYTTCGGTCVLVAQQIRGALDELEAEHAPRPAVLIVSADPATDTPARTARFLAEVSLSGRAQYLTGPLARVARVWRAYHVRAASAGRATFDEYASVLLVDAGGAERVLFQSEQLTPEAISHDVRVLEGAPAHP